MPGSPQGSPRRVLLNPRAVTPRKDGPSIRYTDNAHKHVDYLRDEMKRFEKELRVITEDRDRDRDDHNKLILNDYDTLLVAAHLTYIQFYAAKLGCDLFASGTPQDPVLARLHESFKRNWSLYCLVDDLSLISLEEQERYSKTRADFPVAAGLFQKYLDELEGDITLVKTPPPTALLKRKSPCSSVASGSNAVEEDAAEEGSSELEYAPHAQDRAYTEEETKIKQEEYEDIDFGTKKKRRTA
ncbi:hypothetical protein EIP86_007622 [Pleurotus ostreatoroseus]|nr:hypothetical protein EIP86_007054 [Pleurotus ostreatoroseus]KAF7796443.1 hypothetical protein EIP86_007620 [Pleurotus ostreatoroseus]KAF7796445.1 hypothetical protein EIP86_007622 [Pleurotus ostreatoroseus]